MLVAAFGQPATVRALASGDNGCATAVAATGRQLLRRTAAILASCHHDIAQNGSGTDCLVDTATVQKRTAVANRLTERLGTVCSDAEIAALTLGGACLGTTTVAGLVDCLLAGHEADAEAVSALVDVATAPLTPHALTCSDRASSAVRTFAARRLRLLQRCKRAPRIDRLPPRTDCPDEPHTAKWLGVLRGRAGAAIAALCDATALAVTPFGAPCNRAASVGDLTTCLLDQAEAASDAALAAEFPDTGFCGDSGAAVEQRIDALLAQMTLADKIDQMHGVAIAGVSHTAANPSLGIPGIVMMDGPRGVGVTGGHATAFPVGIARGATWNPALEHDVGEAMGREARAKGVSMLLAPTINLLRHPRWGRAQETYGEDTVHVGEMAVGFVRGVQTQIIGNPKHFAGNSIEDTRFSVDVQIDERTLREIYLPHFRAAVQRGHAAAVMSAYNKLNGFYCGENAHLLTDVLKDDWSFRGFVESDWVLGTRSTVPSLQAGLDIEMPSGLHYGQPLADAVAADPALEPLIDAAVRRILRAQLCFRLDTDPPVVDPSQVEMPATAELAREVARQGIVLLKNTGSTLPLQAAQLQTIAVIGDLAAFANLGDVGSSTVSPSHSVTPLDGIRARAGAIAVTQYAAVPFPPADAAAIASADVAIVVAGLDYRDEGENLIAAGDRKSLALPRDQDTLIADTAALNPHTIVVLEGSGPVLMPWLADVPAVVMAWYPGQEGGSAIADVLFGDVVPSGKLPLSFPVAEADLPPFDNVSLAVTYDYFHGYRYLDHNGVAPLFPFGFGLSYTQFAYANLTLDRTAIAPNGSLRVTADVTNVGSVAGDEIAQLYVGYGASSVTRAVRDLKGFSRLHLEPGETKTVVFTVRAADLGFWDTVANGWQVEPISYTVEVGPSSRDLPLSAPFQIQ